jgi:hypothetical protein
MSVMCVLNTSHSNWSTRAYRRHNGIDDEVTKYYRVVQSRLQVSANNVNVDDYHLLGEDAVWLL